MSNFKTFGQASQGIPGTAPQIFVASTPDSLGDITATGYLNDLGTKVKQNDVMYINYDDTSVQPVGGGNANEAATLGEFYVNVVGADVNLVNALTALGQAAAKDVTDNTKALVASVSGAFTINNLVSAADTSGTIKDSGISAINSIVLYASVPITAAQFNGMYTAPMLLIAAPGANNMIIVDQMELVMTFVSADYAAGGIVAAQYDSTVHGAGVLATNSEAAADFFAAASTVFKFNGSVLLAPFSTCANKGLYLSNATGAFTTGDSTWVAKIHYRIIALV
jgi:hypothetical protein